MLRHVRARPARAAGASRRMPSTQVRTVASGVFSSCEKPEASRPSDASRCDSASARLGGAALGDVAPHLDDVDDAPVRARGSARRAPPPTRTLPSARRALADADLPLAATARQRERRAVARRCRAPRPASRQRAAEQPPRAPCPCARRNASFAAIDRALRVEHDDPVVDAVDDGLEPLALAAHLADQAGHRVGHRVELAGQPGDRVGALGRHAPLEIARRDQARGRLEPLQPPQHDDADDERDRADEQQRGQRRVPPTIQRRSRFIAARIVADVRGRGSGCR